MVIDEKNKQLDLSTCPNTIDSGFHFSLPGTQLSLKNAATDRKSLLALPQATAGIISLRSI